MNKDKQKRIEDVWSQWITKDIRRWLSFPVALVQTCRILGEGD